MPSTADIHDPEYPALTRLGRAVATLVSYVFHPVFMPVVMMILLYKLAPVNFVNVPVGNILERGSFMNLLFVVGNCTIFFPLITVLLMKTLGFVKSIEMHDVKDRMMPLLANMIFYFWAYHVINNIGGTPFILKALLLGTFWGVIAIFVVSIFVKISMHAVAAGGMVGILAVLLVVNPINMLPALYTGLLLAGGIGTARLLLRAHAVAEVWLGYFVGALLMFGAAAYLSL